ncbi:MAG TPA: RyR domain-containing protein [Phycisphaerales bacterium]|nr:RyR domain-containing protein [Phycisphaerales bacterium]
MFAADHLERLAAIAHDLWRDRMVAHGWSWAPAYDERGRHHDALVPFEQLDQDDRRETLDGVAVLELHGCLADAVRYDRGPEAPLRLREMRRGLGVGWSEAVRRSAAGLPPEPGRVVGWNAEGDRLAWVEVEWSDGARTQHVPGDRELRRL